MSERSQTFYITTAIDYPNSTPHLGHAYEKVLADFYARAARLRGLETRFLIGLDEHGQKIEESAAQAGKAPQAFVDEKAVVFRELYRLLEISNDDFIRTSEPRHRSYAAWFYERVRDRGDIYKGVYEADYCVSCERALTKSELVDGKCPTHERPTTKIAEESYFFRLAKYRDQVREHIERHPEFVIPAERRNEVLSRLREEVRDLSISRSTFTWGIPLPGEPRHVLYVWFDALANYISALKSPVDVEARFWPADCHVIGKDILWFHTVIWPAMLLSAGVELPRQVLVHGFILDKDGRKMSKHLENAVNPADVVREYSVDVLRYYLLKAFPGSQDAKFSLEDLDERYHRELGNDLGNLVMRVAKLARTTAGEEFRRPPGALDVSAAATASSFLQGLVEDYFAFIDAREHHRAMERLWVAIRSVNAYLNDQKPWEKGKASADVARTVYSALEALRVITHLLEPAMPRTSAQVAATLGFPLGPLAGIAPGSHIYRVQEATPLFPRREKPAAVAASGSAETGPGPGKAPPGQAPVGATQAGSPGAASRAPIDPFARLDLRVGRIVEVKEHPEAERLYALIVDIGGERRSICAGLRQHLKAEDLQGRSVVVVANLKPAMLRGIESSGMVLASDTLDGRVVPVDPGGAESGDAVYVEGVTPDPKAKLSLGDFEKVPLVVEAGRVVYAASPLRTRAGFVTCDAVDGSRVR